MYLEFYKEQIRGMLEPKRFNHSLGVMEAAVHLAGRYGACRKQAAVAGLLHDCARDLPGGRLLELAREYSLNVDKTERATPILLHARVGAIMAFRRLGVKDEAILRAIALHTVGGCDMTLLDKVVFVADKIEDGRRFTGVETLRAAAGENLDRALLACFDMALKLSLRRGEPVHPRTVMARNFLLTRRSGCQVNEKGK